MDCNVGVPIYQKVSLEQYGYVWSGSLSRLPLTQLHMHLFLRFIDFLRFGVGWAAFNHFTACVWPSGLKCHASSQNRVQFSHHGLAEQQTQHFNLRWEDGCRLTWGSILPQLWTIMIPLHVSLCSLHQYETLPCSTLGYTLLFAIPSRYSIAQGMETSPRLLLIQSYYRNALI